MSEEETESTLKIIEIIANMKSNNGNVKQWARQLEDALGVEQLCLEMEK